MVILVSGWSVSIALAGNPQIKPSKYDQLMQLVGEWEGKKPMQNGEEIITVRYQLTAKGTALMETLFPDSPKEMVSVYARDGQDIVMTHYCMLGNQPRMKTVRQDTPESLTLTYIDGTGMRSYKDMHMHQLMITFLDSDHITHKWTLFDKGKKKLTETFAFTRKN